MIRAFVAIPIPEALWPVLEAAQSGLQLGRIVDADAFHLTLAFLGNQTEPLLADVHDALSTISQTGFGLDLDGLGTFGDASPRVLFAAIKPNPALADLRRAVRSATREAGLELEHKRFHPHITLARFGKGLTGEAVPALHAHVARRMGLVRGSFSVAGFTLYESRLGRDGALYDPMAEYELETVAGPVA